MRCLLIAVLICLSWSLKAHDAAIASFYIYKDENQWTLRTDFAWSIRSAIIKKYPFLKEKGTDNDEFVDCVKEYLENHISIKIDDHLLAFKSIYQVPGAHTHSYVFVAGLDGPFEGTTLKIENKCMFEFYTKQKNIIYFENKEVFILDRQHASGTINLTG